MDFPFWRYGLKLLIADDSYPLFERLRLMLNRIAGIEVVGHASSGQQALELVASLAPEVLILDIEMPGGNGIDVLQQMRAAGNTAIVIVLTNHSSEFYRDRCMSLGADHFFDKTMEFKQAVSTLTMLTRSRPNTVQQSVQSPAMKLCAARQR
jgi:DNA-binding NarL/FixJ family response regulator